VGFGSLRGAPWNLSRCWGGSQRRDPGVFHVSRKADAKAFKTKIDLSIVWVWHASRKAGAKAFGTEINHDLSRPYVVCVLHALGELMRRRLTPKSTCLLFVCGMLLGKLMSRRLGPKSTTCLPYLFLVCSMLCSADGSTHTESTKLYRKVKHRARPNLSSRRLYTHAHELPVLTALAQHISHAHSGIDEKRPTEKCVLGELMSRLLGPKSTFPHLSLCVSWPLHDLAITNIVCCKAKQGRRGETIYFPILIAKCNGGGVAKKEVLSAKNSID